MGRPKADARDKRIGQQIRLRRHAVGLTLQAVGSAMGISYQAVQKIEKGEYRISAPQLETLAAALNVQPSFFFEQRQDAEAAEATTFALTWEGRAICSALAGVQSQVVRRQIIRLIISIVDEYESGRVSEPCTVSSQIRPAA